MTGSVLARLHGGEPVLGETGAVQALVFVPLDLAWINHLVTEEQRPSRASFPVPDRLSWAEVGGRSWPLGSVNTRRSRSPSAYRRPQLIHAPSTSAIKQGQRVMSRNR
jgi:hypothetical protein